MSVEIAQLEPPHQPWVAELMREHFGSELVVSRGRARDTTALPGLVAVDDGVPVGFLRYSVEGAECEVVSLVSAAGRRGTGSKLLEAVASHADAAGCVRLVLMTTNDNVSAQRFYERCGFQLAATHAGAVTRSRALKPEIPLVGEDGVEIEDELEYERSVGQECRS